MADADVPATFGSYLRGHELGHGSSGRVFSCVKRGKGAVQYAAKAIDLRRLRLSAKADRELKKLKREIDILKRVPPHRNLVRFVDSLETGNWCFLVLEFIGGGDLYSTLIRRGTRPSFHEVETVFVLRQLVEGLDFLHGHSIIHRDLKLENILNVSEDRCGEHLMCSVKITDFGLSKVVGAGLSVARSTVGSPHYIAPEVLAMGEHDFRADLWSLGVLLYVLLAGKFPFEGSPNFPQQVLDDTVGGLGASEAARAVVRGLMRLDRGQRLTLEMLRGHPLLEVEQCDVLQAGPLKRPRLARLDSVHITSVSLFGSEDVPADPPTVQLSEESVKITEPEGDCSRYDERAAASGALGVDVAVVSVGD